MTVRYVLRQPINGFMQILTPLQSKISCQVSFLPVNACSNFSKFLNEKVLRGRLLLIDTELMKFLPWFATIMKSWNKIFILIHECSAWNFCEACLKLLSETFIIKMYRSDAFMPSLHWFPNTTISNLKEFTKAKKRIFKTANRLVLKARYHVKGDEVHSETCRLLVTQKLIVFQSLVIMTSEMSTMKKRRTWNFYTISSVRNTSSSCVMVRNIFSDVNNIFLQTE